MKTDAKNLEKYVNQILFRNGEKYVFSWNCKKNEESFPTLLGHVGCYILFNSKNILLKRLLFLLKFLNPKLAQLLYMDTDSAHFLLKHSSRKCKPFFIWKLDPKCLAYG